MHNVHNGFSQFGHTVITYCAPKCTAILGRWLLSRAARGRQEINFKHGLYKWAYGLTHTHFFAVIGRDPSFRLSVAVFMV